MPDGATPDTIANLRRDLAAAYRLIALNGMDDSIYTHISARMPDGPGGEKRFLLNPFGLRFDEVTAENLVLVDANGTILEGEGPIQGAAVALHGPIHARRRERALRDRPAREDRLLEPIALCARSVML